MVLLVKDFMKQGLLTLSPDSSAFDALRLCHDRRIRHIPVVEDDRLAGIVSDRDIRDASPSLGDPERVGALKEMRVGNVMTREVVTARPQDTIVHAAQEMYERKIDALPVTVGEELVGIVTSSDAMRALVTLSGAHEPDISRVAVRAQKPGVLAEAADISRDQGVDVFSVLSSPQKRAAYDRTLIFQLATKDPSSVIRGLETAGYEVSWRQHGLE
ncbi:MAG: CBS and ACT domain-containing protein [Rubrobacteraceae bacterium]